MYIKLKNKTENEIILTDVDGISIAPGSTREFTNISDEQILRSSNVLLDYIGCNKVSVINLDNQELTGTAAVDYINQNKLDLVGAKHFDGRISVYSTCRPFGCITNFTSYGDNGHLIGQGEEARYHHRVGDNSIETKYLDFHSIDNQTWVHDAIVSYKDCTFDDIYVSIVSAVQQYDTASNTNFFLHPVYKTILPAAGNGNVDISNYTLKPVQFLKNQQGTKPLCFWDATYNGTTHQFTNLVPKPNGDGNFNLFSEEISLQYFVRWDLVGTGVVKLNTNDVDRIGHNMRLKFVFETNNTHDDHDWWVSILIHLFREKTF
jgi:hypothetical protein